MTQIHLTKADKEKIKKRLSGAGKASFRKGLPSEILKIVAAVMSNPSQDSDVIITSSKENITPNEAAVLLNVSRPFVVKLIQEGKLNAYKVGAHYRLSRKDVLKFKASRDGESKKDFEKLDQSLNELVNEEGWEE